MSWGLFKNVFTNHIYSIYVNKKDLALNNLLCLISHKLPKTKKYTHIVPWSSSMSLTHVRKRIVLHSLRLVLDEEMNKKMTTTRILIKLLEKKTRWELLNNSAYFEQILEAAPYKTASVHLLTPFSQTTQVRRTRHASDIGCHMSRLG